MSSASSVEVSGRGQVVDAAMVDGASLLMQMTWALPFPQRLAQPAEYAQLAAFLIEHDYLNGETVRMDGALRMAPR